MDLLCHRRRGCEAGDHAEEFRYTGEKYSLEVVRRRVAEAPPEAFQLLQRARLNWLNTRNPVHMFLSGSLVVDCVWEDSACKQAEALRAAGLAERVESAYLIPYTLLSDQLFEYLPLPEVSEEEYEVKRHYVVSLRGLAAEGEPVEGLARFLEAASAFLGRRLEKVVSRVSQIPKLVNRYVDRIDILLKGVDGSLVGLGYVDVSRTYHLGFTAMKSFLMYGLDNAVLVHPYVDHGFHRDISNRIRLRWDISEVGYLVLNLMEEEAYVYRLPRRNRYLAMSPSAQRHSRAVRSYMEQL